MNTKTKNIILYVLLSVFVPASSSAADSPSEKKAPASSSVAPASSSVADSPSEKKAPASSSAAESPSEKFQFASLYDENEEIPDGDLVTLNRRIGNWYLECSISVSKQKRICHTEQYIYKDDNWIRWSFSATKDGKAYVVVNAPVDIQVKDGIKMSFSGLEKTLNDITCGGGACTTSFQLEGVLQSAILSSKTIAFRYKTKNNADMTLSNDMTGLLYALEVASSNPLADVMNDKSPNGKKNKKNK